MRGNYLAAPVRYPDRAGWPPEDLVYFSEDDYLHDPQAFVALEAAAIPSAGYFALCASTPEHPALGPRVPFKTPADWVDRPGVDVAGRHWVNVASTPSTFGARGGCAQLRADWWIFRQGMVPYRSRLLDHETCLVYQGRFPYTAKEIILGPPSTHSGPD